jgi:hypothetical protein
VSNEAEPTANGEWGLFSNAAIFGANGDLLSSEYSLKRAGRFASSMSLSRSEVIDQRARGVIAAVKRVRFTGERASCHFDESQRREARQPCTRLADPNDGNKARFSMTLGMSAQPRLTIDGIQPYPF